MRQVAGGAPGAADRVGGGAEGGGAQPEGGHGQEVVRRGPPHLRPPLGGRQAGRVLAGDPARRGGQEHRAGQHQADQEGVDGEGDEGRVSGAGRGPDPLPRGEAEPGEEGGGDHRPHRARGGGARADT